MIRNFLKPGILLAFCLALCLGLVSCDSMPFGGGEKKDKTPPAKSPAAKPGQDKGTPPRLKATGKKKASDTDKEEEEISEDMYNEKLIEEAELDSLRATFEKETGRDDPFEYVPFTSFSGTRVMEENPEQYRVLGTAKTPDGNIAMIQMGTEYPIVHEGDLLENGSTVLRIEPYTVVLLTNGEEFTLSMRTVSRQPSRKSAQMGAVDESLQQMLELDVDNLYDMYLKDKYAEDDFFSMEQRDKPKSFDDYLDKREEKLKKKDNLGDYYQDKFEN